MPSTPLVDDVDDLYGTPSANNTPAAQPTTATDYLAARHSRPSSSQPAGIPGLGMFSSPALSQPPQAQAELSDQALQPQDHAATEQDSHADQPLSHQNLSHDSAVNAEPVLSQENVVVDSTQPAHQHVEAVPRDAASALFDALGNNEDMTNNLPSAPDAESAPVAAPTSSKPPVDPEFLEAAQAQKSNKNAEWQFDSSDEESSSDDSSSDDSSSEDDSDEEYELLDPATTARMLMEEGGMDEDDGANKAANQAQLRTKNEQPEVIIPKPDVTVTPDMQIKYLGDVQHVVENLILIKGHTTGEYQVLESNSVLCLENREVIGAVQETIGKVEEPLYSVAFTRPSDITDLGIAPGTKIFFVPDASFFVFTEPLRNMKGTDASNLHDEEVAEEEMEFSDDEAEAAYKRAKKEAKKGARSVQNPAAQPQAAKPYTGGAINYDDEPEAEDMYTPLARPDNLQDMLAGGAPPPRRQFADRGRGRGRGRGDRGRGDRGRGGRGGRGGADNSNQRKGPSNSYPDTHNAQASSHAQQALPPRPAIPQQQQQQQQQQQMWPLAQPQLNALQFPFNQFGQQQFPPPPPPPQFPSQYPNNMPYAWPPNPTVFNQNQQQQPFQFPPTTPGGSIPAGAFVNPAFFQPQQQPQQHQQTPAAPAQANPPSDEQIKNAQALWRRLQQQR